MDLSQSQTGATAKLPPPKEQKATSCAPPPQSGRYVVPPFEGPPASQTGNKTSCGPGRMVLPPFDPAKLPPALQVQKKKRSITEIQRMAKKRWYERSKTNGKYQRNLQMNRLRKQVRSVRKRAMNSNNRMMVSNYIKATNPFNSLVDSADYCAAKEQNLGVGKVSEQVRLTGESGMGDNLKWFACVAVLDMNCSKKK
jgi:hypothetical protein